MPSARWPIRDQIFWPFAGTTFLAVATIVAATTWVAVQRNGRQTIRQLQAVVATLESATFPFTEGVLLQMRGLSGAEFIALDRSDRITAATIGAEGVTAEWLQNVPTVQDAARLIDVPPVELGEARYFASRLRPQRPSAQGSLVVLYPVASWRELQWGAAWPPLAIGGLTLALIAAASSWIAGRFARRIEAVRALFADIAAGRFGQAAIATPHDELTDLVASANQLSAQLADLQRTIQQREREQLMAQLAGALAHQLRNDVTGARMAVQLHRKNCPHGDQESLGVALRQLALTEEHVQAFLTLGRPDGRSRCHPARIGEVLDEIQALLAPTAAHGRITLKMDVAPEAAGATIADAHRVRSVLINLLMNGLEAAGSGGTVQLTATCADGTLNIDVTDTGPGPPESVRTTLFEPFVTSKPEGAGLGLAIARQATEALRGRLTWSRENNRTRFQWQLPLSNRDETADSREQHPRKITQPAIENARQC